MSDEATIPTEDELRQLPRWAVVAFAARCARRVQPLFKALQPKARYEHVKAVEEAISLAEQAAASAHRIVNNAAFAAPYTATSADADVARAAAYAARAARSVSKRDANEASARAVVHAAEIADTADTVSIAVGEILREAARAIRADFNKLKSAAEKEGWTDETPVPPAIFGPMWPDGLSEAWPVQQGCELSIIVDSSVDPQTFADFLGELANFYSELTGGDELIIKDGTVPAPKEVLV